MKKIRSITMVGVLSAISWVLMFFEFPLPFFPSFLKIDVSDLPALLAALSMGPLYGVAVELIKNLLHLPFSDSGGIGGLANFIVGSALVFPAGLVYRICKTKKGAALGLACGTLLMGIVGGLANHFILIPFYVTVMNFPLQAIINSSSKFFPQVDSLFMVIVYSIVPFNLLKGFVLSAIMLLSYKKLSQLLKPRK